MLLGDIMRRNAAKYPDKAGLVNGAEVYTFAQLNERCNQVANAMSDIAAFGDRIAILAENIPEYVECYYGVPDAGMALTFLNYRLHPKEWAWIMNNAQVSTLLVQDKYLDAVEPFLAEVPSLKAVVVIGRADSAKYPNYEDLVGSASPEYIQRKTDDDTIAWLLYTSGTTGFPKGAMLSHRNLMAAIISVSMETLPAHDDVNLLGFPMCHIAGYLIPLYHLRGGTNVLFPQFEPELWMQTVDKYGVTITSLAPTMLNMVLEHPKCDEYKLTSLARLAYGSAAMPIEILKRAMDRFGPIFWTAFGMTETSGNNTYLSSADHERAANGAEHLLASCGRVNDLSEVMIVDENFNECPPGVIGEIVCRGEQVLSGYFNNVEATQKSFTGEWFHTGDAAYRDEEGYLYIADRIKDMILTGGENVYSREVEDVLYTHPAVSEAAVIGLPDVKWGENVCAVIKLKDGMTATEADIINTVRDRLAGYKKPKKVFFIDEMPKTVTGKIMKRELRDRFANDSQ
jgi:acyl-CoA synthetase (AMP-forming)/AMP-acid ligase II